MTVLKPSHWRVLAELADGLPQHVSQLAREADMKPQQLNGFWQQMPAHIRGLLRQHDGYWRLVRPLAVFDAEGLRDLGERSGFQTALKHECASSNDEILELARIAPDKAHKTICVTHLQSKGRGRQGRKWSHRLGECLMFSFGWAFDRPQYELGSLSPVAALACRRALGCLGLETQIKWPNDLVVGRDKLGGILIETVRAGGKTVAVVGIGINFVLPKEVENAASVQSLFQTASRRGNADAAVLLETLLAELGAVLEQYAEEGFAPFLNEYETANRDHGKAVLLLRDGETVCEGTVKGVDGRGVLHLETAEGEQTVVSGEISLRPDDRSVSVPKRRDSERFCCWTAGTAGSSGRGWKTARSQPSAARRTAICRLWARSGRKRRMEMSASSVAPCAENPKGTSEGTARPKNRVAAVFRTGFGHTQPLPPPRRTRFRPLVQRLGQPPLQPQRLRRRQLRHGGNG